MFASCHTTFVVLELLNTHFKLAVFNTHFDHKSELARQNSAVVLLNKAKELGLPFVICGNFNCPLNSKVRCLHIYLKYLCNCFIGNGNIEGNTGNMRT